MCAGVRDVGNLCWKLDAVLTGSLPESVLDTYQAERLPHVKEVTNRAVKIGKLIVERNPLQATLRNNVFRTLGKLPYFTAWLREHRWLPDARYRDGLLARNGNDAVGWLVPQPRVTDGNGEQVRLDDIIGAGGRSCIPAPTPVAGLAISRGGHPRDRPAWQLLRPPIIVDHEDPDPLARPKHASAVVAVRPDGFVYAAGGEQPLPPPRRDSRRSSPNELGQCMTTVESEHIVRVNNADIFVADTGGDGSAVVMLHGGGPGRPGCRITHATSTRWPVAPRHRPGHAGLRAVLKHVDHSDPFGYLADIRFAARSTNWVSPQHI